MESIDLGKIKNGRIHRGRVRYNKLH